MIWHVVGVVGAIAVAVLWVAVFGVKTGADGES